MQTQRLRIAAIGLGTLALVQVAPAPVRAFDVSPWYAAPSSTLLHRVAVFGPDNRIRLPVERHSLRDKIGSLYETRSRSICTAFCISRDTVATAAHCLFRTDGEAPPRLNGFIFQLDGTRSRATSRIRGAEKGFGGHSVISGSTRLSVTPPIQASQDWAAVKLTEPVCTAGGLKIAPMEPEELAAVAEAGLIYQIGYHRDLPTWELVHGGPCWMRMGNTPAERNSIARDFDDTRNLILHTCDTGGASSGSPLLVDGPRGPEVVGINVGTYVRSKVLMQNGEVVHRYKSDSVSNTAVAGGAFAAAVKSFASARLLENKAELIELQDRLGVLGYYSGSRDGVYGPKLRAAIEAYERATKRPIAGIASTDLLKQLAAETTNQLTARAPIQAIETGSIKRTSAKKK